MVIAGTVKRDANGFILTGPDLTTDDELYNNKNNRPKGWNLDRRPFLLETNVPGIFAAGDVHSGSVKRVASGVGEVLLLFSLFINISRECDNI